MVLKEKYILVCKNNYLILLNFAKLISTINWIYED